MGKVRLSDKEFWAILRENAGLFSRTARAIKKQYGIEFSRQAVEARAKKKPELLQDIFEENLDIAEEGLIALMRSKDWKAKQRAIEFYLKNKGKSRGYALPEKAPVPDVPDQGTEGGEKPAFNDKPMSKEELANYMKEIEDSI